MEVVGAVASVVTLAEVAIKATRQARKLHKRLRDAPLDLESLRENVGIIETITEQLALLSGDGVEAPGLREALAATETELRALNEEIDRHIPAENDVGKLRTRVRWAWFTPSAIKENNRRVSVILAKLQMLMTFYILCAIRGPKQVPGEEKAIEATICDEPSDPATNFEQVASRVKVTPKFTKHFRIPSWLCYLGIMGSICKQDDEAVTTWRVTIRIFVPTFCTAQPRAVAIDLAWNATSNSWEAVQGIRQGIRFANVISAGAKIVRACKAGNVTKMQKLFAKGKASVDDVTPENDTLLYLAIESGNVEAVKFLLQNNADVNWTFGKNQTSALQWALYKNHLEITRLLLTYRADGTYTSMTGWTPIHYLFQGGYLHGGSWTPEDFLCVLASHGDTLFLDLEAKDREGYSSLQIAASWYPGSVVAKLLWLGASMDEFGAEPWEHPSNPIRFAIIQGNTSAFESLLPLYDNVNARDHLGLLMLSYTARHGREEMTEHLLSLGSFEIFPEYHQNDEQYWDGRSDTDDGSNEDDWEDEGLKEWTKENYDKYMEALRRHNRIAVLCDDEDGELCFWDAERGVDFDD